MSSNNLNSASLYKCPLCSIHFHFARHRKCRVMAVKSPKILSYEEKDEEKRSLIRRRISCSSKNPRCCRYSCFKYRLIILKEKGTILMIVLNALCVMMTITCYQHPTLVPPNYNTTCNWLTIVFLSVPLLFPILGLLSQCCISKYRIFQLSIYSLLLSIVLIALSIISQSAIIWFVAMIPLVFSSMLSISCIIPLTMDQAVGASGEELSFTMYWLVWPTPTSVSVLHIVECYSLSDNAQYNDLALFTVSALLFIAFFSLLQCFSHFVGHNISKIQPCQTYRAGAKLRQKTQVS